MNFPLYAGIALLAIGLVVFAAFCVVAWIDGMSDDADPDWDGKGEP